MAVTLDAPVDAALLDDALQSVMKRFPSFRYSIRRGLFWWFLQKLDNDPAVCGFRRLAPIDVKRNGGYMFKLGCSDSRIFLDVYHALTDGNGALTFLLSTVAEYLKLSGGAAVEYGKWIYNPDDEPIAEELEDGFDKFSGTKGALDEEKKAWHIKGTEELPDVLNSMSVSFSSEQVHAKAKELGCTVTELLSALMLTSLQEVHASQKGRKRQHIRMELPVNLRPIFGSRTLRNFSSYVYLSLDLSNGYYSFEDALREVKYQKRLYMQPARLTRRIAANVQLEDNLGIRIIPLFIKKPIINLINFLKGDNYGTYTFSNIGNVELPEGVARHIRDLNFVLGRTRGRSGSCAGVSFGGRMYLNFTRKIAEDCFERIFVRKLRELGIWARIEVPAGPLRPLNRTEPSSKPRFSGRSILPRFLLSF
ncbi:MAG: hypothetical protein IK031_00375 [Bacteroidales bacterium]|nr:hypothetical protein [Bacteroidales bacterium]